MIPTGSSNSDVTKNTLLTAAETILPTPSSLGQKTVPRCSDQTLEASLVPLSLSPDI